MADQLEKIYCKHSRNNKNVAIVSIVQVDMETAYFFCGVCWNALRGKVLTDLLTGAIHEGIKESVNRVKYDIPG